MTEKMKNYNLAVVGATGNVGREILNILDQRSFPIKKLHALASNKSEGTKLTYGDDKEITVEDLDKFNFKGTDIVLSSPGSSISKKFVKTTETRVVKGAPRGITTFRCQSEPTCGEAFADNTEK